jgi:hypothetical protein
MSLGAITGVVVIMRTFFQFVQGDYDYSMPSDHCPPANTKLTLPSADYMVFMLLFNFLEPAATIIAQTIPIFRVLFRHVRRTTQASKSPGVHIHRPASNVELVPTRWDASKSPVWDRASGSENGEPNGRKGVEPGDMLG